LLQRGEMAGGYGERGGGGVGPAETEQAIGGVFCIVWSGAGELGAGAVEVLGLQVLRQVMGHGADGVGRGGEVRCALRGAAVEDGEVSVGLLGVGDVAGVDGGDEVGGDARGDGAGEHGAFGEGGVDDFVDADGTIDIEEAAVGFGGRLEGELFIDRDATQTGRGDGHVAESLMVAREAGQLPLGIDLLDHGDGLGCAGADLVWSGRHGNGLEAGKDEQAWEISHLAILTAG